MNVSGGGGGGASALSGLSDVTISSPSNGQALVYNNGTGKWENAAVSATNSTYCYARCTDGSNGGGGGELDLTWDGTLYFAESEAFRNPSDKKQLIVPTGKGGKYRIRIICMIQNAGTGLSFLRVLINGAEKDRQGQSGPSGAYQQLVLEYIATLSAGDVITASVNVNGNGYYLGDYGGVKGGTSISVESWT